MSVTQPTNREDFRRGPEPYLGWYLEGAPGSPTEPASFICYANEDRGTGSFRVRVDASALILDRAEQYKEAGEAAFTAAMGLVFLGTWMQGDEWTMSLPAQTQQLRTPEIRDALIRGLHRLYEADFNEKEVDLDYEGIGLALGVPGTRVVRAAEHLKNIGLVTDYPATLSRDWSTGSIWLTAAGVEYAEQLPPVAVADTRETATDDETAWDLFIAHASEDKADVARPLYDLLTRRGVTVWLDENELQIGDSLARKIDEGLAKSRHGIVIISEHFFAKEWPQRELGGLTTKELSGGKTILPVWHNVDRDYVARFSPTLAGKYAAKTSDELPKVVDDILRAIGHPEAEGSDSEPTGEGGTDSPPTAEVATEQLAIADGALPTFELVRKAVKGGATRFTPDWRIKQASGEYVRYVEWRFAGPGFRTQWSQASGNRLEETAISAVFDLTQPPGSEDERIGVDEIGLDLRFRWRGQLRHELHRWTITKSGSADAPVWSVGDEIIPPQEWTE